MLQAALWHTQMLHMPTMTTCKGKKLLFLRQQEVYSLAPGIIEELSVGFGIM